MPLAEPASLRGTPFKSFYKNILNLNSLHLRYKINYDLICFLNQITNFL